MTDSEIKYSNGMIEKANLNFSLKYTIIILS